MFFAPTFMSTFQACTCVYVYKVLRDITFFFSLGLRFFLVSVYVKFMFASEMMCMFMCMFMSSYRFLCLPV